MEKKQEVKFTYEPQDLVLFKKHDNISKFVNKNYGFNNCFKRYFYSRTEIPFNLPLFKNHLYTVQSVRALRAVLPYISDFKTKWQANLFYLYVNRSYRGIRHLHGLPTRGQRT